MIVTCNISLDAIHFEKRALEVGEDQDRIYFKLILSRRAKKDFVIPIVTRDVEAKGGLYVIVIT